MVPQPSCGAITHTHTHRPHGETGSDKKKYMKNVEWQANGCCHWPFPSPRTSNAVWKSLYRGRNDIHLTDVSARTSSQLPTRILFDQFEILKRNENENNRATNRQSIRYKRSYAPFHFSGTQIKYRIDKHGAIIIIIINIIVEIFKRIIINKTRKATHRREKWSEKKNTTSGRKQKTIGIIFLLQRAHERPKP